MRSHGPAARSFSGILVLICLFGGTAAAVYPLSIAHACDYVEHRQMLAASSGLLLSGRSARRSDAGRRRGDGAVRRCRALFLMLASAALLLAAFVRYRITRRVAKPADEQTNSCRSRRSR
jgi:hypothetical protein